MAVIRLVHASRHADCNGPDRAAPFCHWRADPAGGGDVVEWQGAEELVIHWGDPVVRPALAELSAQARGDRALPLFGRSWLHYHRPSHRLTVVPDAQGLFPVLLQHDRGRTRIASDSLAMVELLGGHALPDHDAALELLSWGRLQGLRSTLAGVIRLEPGSVAGCTDRNLALHSPACALPAPCGAGEADLAEALVAALARRFDHDRQALLDLGGPAWKLLLAGALAAGARPTLVAIGPGHDRWGVGNLARACGLNLLQGSRDPQARRRAHLGIALAGGGEVPLHRGHERLCEELLSVTAGATLVTATALGPGHDRRPPTAADGPRSGSGEVSLPVLERGEAAGLQLQDRHYARSHPLLDPEWLALLGSLPERLRRDPALPGRLIRRLAPRLADLEPGPDAGQRLRLVTAENQDDFLPAPVDESADLNGMLRACGLLPAAATTLERRLLAGPDRIHALGVAGAFNRWARYLERQRQARAA